MRVRLSSEGVNDRYGSAPPGAERFAAPPPSALGGTCAKSRGLFPDSSGLFVGVRRLILRSGLGWLVGFQVELEGRDDAPVRALRRGLVVSDVHLLSSLWRADRGGR